MAKLDREGTFKASIISHGLKETDGGALQLVVQYAILSMWYAGEWHDWAEYDQTCWGNHTLIAKDGKPVKAQVESIMAALGWGGSLRELQEGDWAGHEVKITVKESVYNNETSYRAEWMNDVNATMSVGNVDDDRLKALDAKFGGQLRALARPGTAPVAGKPAAPKRTPRTPAAPPSAPATQEEALAANAQNPADDIPF